MAAGAIYLAIFLSCSYFASAVEYTFGSTVYVYYEDAETWEDAHWECEKDDSTMVMIDSASKQTLMQSLHDKVANRSTELWLGLTRYRYSDRDDDKDPRHLVWYNTQGCTDCAMDEDKVMDRALYYQGCYNRRDIDMTEIDNPEIWDDTDYDAVDPESCADECRSQNSRNIYAALGHSSDKYTCYCSTSDFGDGEISSKVCSKTCPNDNNYKCGSQNGRDYLSVFKMDGQTGKWGYGKPDNHDGGDDGEDQTCVALDGDKLDGKYNDEDCFNPHGYICENKGITVASQCDSNDQFPLLRGNGSLRCLEVITEDEGEGLNWWQAREECKDQGWQMFAPDDVYEHQQILDAIADSSEKSLDEAKYWVNIARHMWYWAARDDYETGIDLTYTSWGEEMPELPENHCVSTKRSVDRGVTTYFWKDQDCEEELNFFCEKPTSTTTTLPTTTTTPTTTTATTTKAPTTTTQATTTTTKTTTKKTTTKSPTTTTNAETTTTTPTTTNEATTTTATTTPSIQGPGTDPQAATGDEDGLSTTEIILIILCGVIALLIIIILIVACCYRLYFKGETRVDPGKSDVYGVNMRSEAAYPYSGYIGEDWPYYNGSETGSTSNLLYGPKNKNGVPARTARGHFHSDRVTMEERY